MRILMPSMLVLGMPGTMRAVKKDTLILNRIYRYQQAHNLSINNLQDNVYAKFCFDVERRNPTLWLIPKMYVVAKDPRKYIRESYSTVSFKDAHDYEITNQVISSTIRKNRKALPTLLDYMTPNIYDVALYDQHMFSPFNLTNRKYYRFKVNDNSDGTTRLEFRPKIYNTQLVNGFAIVETNTGRIIRTLINGEFDMITFRTEITQGDEGARSLMPQRISTAATFRFLGNRVSAFFNAVYNNPTVLPDTLKDVDSKALMDSIRPIPLSESDKRIYAEKERHDHKPVVEEAEKDTTPPKKDFWRDIMWHTVGDNLVTPIDAESDVAAFSLSPIINPLYLRYSKSRGTSYKMRLNTRFKFSEHRYLTFEPQVGYNFKQRQLYVTAPLRMVYNPKRNGYAEIIYVNGNHISNSTVLDAINHEHGDTINFRHEDADKFIDKYLRVFNNIMVFDWIDIEAGLTIHQRTAIEKDLMKQYGVPVNYKSFAPVIGLKIRPLLNNGPVIAIDWERSFKGVDGSNISYERWEFDASWKYKLPGLRVINLRSGYGFYSDRHENYFLDYANFRDNNLPEGWDDDWSGEFQLLDGRVYNESNFYLRNNLSYESPMLFATWLPYVGKYIEKERFYISQVLVQKRSPYYELGYGFTNRYISVGLFTSFFNLKFQRIGLNFDFELFKRW